jgi:anti-sigma B factor antagonist
MTISTEKNGGSLILRIEGSINTQTSEQFEKAVQEAFKATEDLIIDFSKVDYVSSSGLRVLLGAENALDEGKKMRIRNVSPEVKEVFDMTGFTSILTLE